MSTITPAQIRGARGMLDWSLTDLAGAAGVSVSTVKRIQDGGTAVPSPATAGLVQRALETAGIEFLADEGSGPGMRLRPRPSEVFSRFL